MMHMRDEGYWLNVETGKFLLIDEHARWIVRQENAQAIGLDEALFARLAGLDPQQDRLRIVLTGMYGGLMRIRRHRESVTFEFVIPTEQAVSAVHRFLQATGLVVDMAWLRLNNLRTKLSVGIRCDEFMRQAGVDPCAIAHTEVRAGLNYDEITVDKINAALHGVAPGWTDQCWGIKARSGTAPGVKDARTK
jgi:hypothetical protein